MSTVNVYVSPSTYDNWVQIYSLPCNILGMVVENTSLSVRYVQIFDLTRQPTADDRPLISIKMAAGSQESFDATFTNQSFSNGFVVANSTTGSFYTDPAANELFLSVWWY